MTWGGPSFLNNVSAVWTFKFVPRFTHPRVPELCSNRVITSGPELENVPNPNLLFDGGSAKGFSGSTSAKCGTCGGGKSLSGGADGTGEYDGMRDVAVL
mmetsp:Transcript_12549/g.18778  ORF Transcript_12549/g.18778 Transcript_12549/m.18778 type:complete len:99 (-) Transcript_12549:2084-2380(-)